MKNNLKFGLYGAIVSLIFLLPMWVLSVLLEIKLMLLKFAEHLITIFGRKFNMPEICSDFVGILFGNPFCSLPQTKLTLL